MQGVLIKEEIWFKKNLYGISNEKSTETAIRKSLPVNQKSKHILLGEGQPILQKVYRAGLEQLGRQIDCANTGRKILEFYYSHFYLLIILSNDLSDMTNLLIAQEIREHEQTSGQLSTPILLLAEAPYDQIKKDCARLNINNFLIKPVRLTELQTAVQHLLTETFN